jgi:N-acetylglucosaminyldiphosphoundecaprenol N-acetyl-beta-D-mannosaminyltransferase
MLAQDKPLQLREPGRLQGLLGGIDINVASPGQAIQLVLQRLRAGQEFVFFTLNMDHVAKLRDNARFLQCYQKADLVSADGWPIVWLHGRDGPKLERTTGADLVQPLCRAAAEEEFPVYFIGPLPAVQARAIASLREQFPTLIVAGAEAPMIATGDGQVLTDIAERIRESGARLCVLSLGAPKQEIIATELRSRCPGVGFLCVGAALDFIAGESRRAPGWVQSAGMEWLWRLGSDPKRLFFRYVASACMMALLVAGVSPISHSIRR